MLICQCIYSTEHHDAIMQTWGRRCVQLLFIVGAQQTSVKNLTADGRMKLIHLTMPESYENLWQKTKLAFKYIYETYKSASICDFVLKIDQDSYVIMENLQSFLVTCDYN